MGNVHCASSPPPPPMATPPPPPPSYYDQKMPDPPMQTPSVDEAFKHPGVMEDLHKRTKDVFPAAFEGIKLMVNKGLSNHFQVSHTITMGSINPGGYRFGATYVGTQQTGPNEAYPILLGDIDPRGNMNANIIHQIGERIRLKLSCQFDQVKSMTASQVSTDYRGDKYSASLTVANPDFINNSGIIVAHYLKSITSRVALGAELVCQYGSQVPGRQMTLLSIAGRYNGDNAAVSGTLGPHVVHLCYYQKASEQLQIGCELETNLNMGESTASIGYQVDLPKIDMQFRGMVDSNWCVSAVLEKKLQPLPFTMSLSGNMNYNKQVFRLGFGFVIG